MKPIRVLVVDDEPHARRKLRSFLDPRPEAGFIEEANNGITAKEKIRSSHPDLVFLDIRMPGLSGVELASELDRDRPPYIIFTTAYDVYALTAFKLDAVDYLLKPFDRARFALAFERGLRRIERGDPLLNADTLRGFIHKLDEITSRAAPGGSAFMAVKLGNGVRLLPLREIAYVRADGDCVVIVLGTERLHARERIGDLEKRLEGRGFLRIHRSILVNTHHVTEIRPAHKGDQEFTLEGGARLVSSATYKANVKGFIENLHPNNT